MSRSLKAQAAMEYLMTYGWAILIVIIVAAVLYQQGILNPSTFTQSAATGFSGFNVPAGSWKVSSDGSAQLQITNGVGARIRVTTVNMTIGTQSADSVETAGAGNVTVAPNAKSTFTWSAASYSGLSQGTAYSASVVLVYDNIDTGLTAFRTSGTLTGTVS